MPSLKQSAVKVAEKFGVKLVSIERHLNPKADMDAAFGPIFNECRKYTLINVERMYSLYKAVQYISKRGIQGDFVECGVWKGGASMLMAKTLVALGDTSRTIYMYDTYEGMSEPTKEDRSVTGKASEVENIWKNNSAADHNEWCYGPLDDVRRVMESTGYPMDKIKFIKGMVEDTIPVTMPSKIALLRLDTDWYASTKHELVHLFPLLEKDGVFIQDDYGYWAGARQAVDEYFAEQNLNLFLHRDDFSGITGIRN